MRVTILKPGDIFVTRGEAWISKAIRFFSTDYRERRKHQKTMANHVGMCVDGGTIDYALVVEALSDGVQCHTLRYSYAGESDLVQIWRPKNIPAEAMKDIIKEAERYVGKKYGWTKVFLHSLGLQRLSVIDKWPICSYVVGKAFETVGYTFGRPGNAITPDDIHDFILENEDKYELVKDWGRIE